MKDVCFCGSVIANLILVIVFSLCMTNQAAAQPPEVSGFQIAWYDEFNGNSLDNSKWTPQFSTNPTNNSLHAYLPQNVSVAGGHLRILSDDNGFQNFQYTSGQVISTAARRYGRVEVRGDLPTTNGMWPAIWLLPINAAWPSQGEIDIMENRGNEPFTTSSAFHYGSNPPFVHNFVYDEFRFTKNGNTVNFHDSFHTYATEWDPDQIRFYVDGVHYYTVRNENVDNFLTEDQSWPMNLIINTAVGGNFLPPPDANTQFPQLFLVDHVFVYDRVGEPVLRLENTNFESGNGSLSNWTLFGSNGANISSDNSHALSGSNALKVFGQFSSNQNFSGIEQGVSITGGDNLTVSANALIDSSDSISGTGNEVFLKIDYYSKQYAAFGSADYIASDQVLLANGSTVNDQWISRELSSTAPANTVEARVAIVFRQVNNGGGAVFVDDIDFENQSETESLSVDNIVFSSGAIQNGAIQSTFESDDQRMKIRAGKNSELPVDLFVESEVAEEVEPSGVSFELEVRANSPNLQLEIFAFNNSTNQFESVALSSVGMQDSVISGSVTGLPGFYLNGAGRAFFQLAFKPVGPTWFFPWSIEVDRAEWILDP